MVNWLQAAATAIMAFEPLDSCADNYRDDRALKFVMWALRHVAVTTGTRDSNTEDTVTASAGQGWVVTYSCAASKACWGPNAGGAQS